MVKKKQTCKLHLDKWNVLRIIKKKKITVEVEKHILYKVCILHYCICVCSLSSTNPLAPEAKHYIDSTDDLKNNGKAQ